MTKTENLLIYILIAVVGIIAIVLSIQAVENSNNIVKQAYGQITEKEAEEYFKHSFESEISNITGIPFDLDKNYTQQMQTNQTEPRTLMTCYTSWVSWSFIANAFLPIHIDTFDPDIKQLFVNICDHVHKKTGIWVNILTDSQNGTHVIPTTSREELLKYYPNGLPDSVKELYNQLKPYEVR
jgi:hypothetical protein